MLVMMMPVSIGVANVMVNGAVVGTIEQVPASKPYVGFDGQTHVGKRWLPTGVDAGIEGPTTMPEAALLLIALETDHDREQAARSLGWGRRAS